MNELNRDNLEMASEWLCLIEEMNEFFKKVVRETKSDDVRARYEAAISYNNELHYWVWRGISEQIVEEYNE